MWNVVQWQNTGLWIRGRGFDSLLSKKGLSSMIRISASPKMEVRILRGPLRRHSSMVEPRTEDPVIFVRIEVPPKAKIPDISYLSIQIEYKCISIKIRKTVFRKTRPKLGQISKKPAYNCRLYNDLTEICNHSHSIVPVGFGVMSYRTLLTPLTSWIMRSVMC